MRALIQIAALMVFLFASSGYVQAGGGAHEPCELGSHQCDLGALAAHDLPEHDHDRTTNCGSQVLTAPLGPDIAISPLVSVYSLDAVPLGATLLHATKLPPPRV